ncbi:LysR family transcriptional regulator [Tatumella ptyseos]|uniref:LysR family transcriptional regulator n=1 Tax=Tatumella ptyseos TaxID=82987 RepID=UPI0026F0DA93|nr:LysR family transcriptional regulator [Tatumella ptyseos]WKX25392.1 LysR family transcriptional regulator [Tatumella ptyseos]
MKREEMSDLMTFMVVAQEQSFTRAAAKLNLSQSAISHTLRKVERNLGVRLLNRTTRSVTCTEAGQRLLDTLQPSIMEIETLLGSLDDYRQLPKGNIRLTATDFAANYFLLPKLHAFIRQYPDINIEIDATSRLVNIVAEGFDAGIRLGEQVEKDMIAVKIGAETQMVVIASPAYLNEHGCPAHPQDLLAHNCINLRMVSSGVLYQWEFQEGDKQFRIKVPGSITCNNGMFAIGSVMKGLGIGCVLKEAVEPHLASGELVQLLSDYTPFFPGFYLYYPSRRQNSTAFRLLIDALRL